MENLYKKLKDQARNLWDNHGLLQREVRVKARALSPEEAIGNPESDDFPLQKGKERLMQAEFGKALGQAFTDQYGDFEGTLEDVLEMPLLNNYRRAIFVATLNAVSRYMNKADKTVHCRDEEPTQCAGDLKDYLKGKYGRIKVLQVGFQPRMVQSLASHFPLRVIDMDPENIGTHKFEIAIEGPETTEEAIQWADLLLVTGTTLVNGTIGMFLGGKPVIFYGTTIAGAASLMGWERFCSKGR